MSALVVIKGCKIQYKKIKSLHLANDCEAVNQHIGALS